MKKMGKIEDNELIEESNKKRDFKNISFRKIVKKSDRKENFKNYESTKISKNSGSNKTRENVTKFENKEFDKYILEMKKLREKEARKKYIKSELLRRKQNLLKFFNMKIGIEEVKRTWQFGIFLLLGIFLFMFYLNFVTFKEELSGEKIFYVKIDGNRGSVLKVNNKYLKNQASIENKKGLEYGFYLMRYKIRKVISKNGNVKIDGKILGYKESRLNGIRKYILNIFDELFITDENLYAFSRAAVLGEKAEVSKDMKDKFKYTGLAHLIVISGTHISLVVIGIVKILDGLSLGYRFKYLMALVALTFYCALIGFSPGILRAYIMGAMMILARILFEEEESKKSLLVSFIVIIVLNPYSVFDISMQLSYAAVVAIIFVNPEFKKFYQEKVLDKIKNEVLRNIVDLIFLSLTIQITSIPLFLYYFEKLPLFSFLLNIVGIPIGTVVIQCLFFVVLLNIFKLSLFNGIVVFVTEIIFKAFEGFIYAGSKIPLLQLNINGKAPLWTVFLYYGVLFFTTFFVMPLFTAKININEN
ncbi:ComEC/Rec2-like protein [Leptotrichia shahii]|uniref:ComEC/Rec2-like protein n=1 Tax=Leptotrichia shahii TaxID=157691 RepID=A0A510JN98_9FUSO|nr:ComEC/Rec2 family competence protein [Leptotrichia shahii]BBM40637.1 ComEC/Rec2-like protein [Leptotrichia shahii]